MANALPILTYHSIDSSGSVVSVDSALFAQQMDHLAAEGWRTLTFAQAVALLTSGEHLPEQHLVITFDDGYRNVYADAFPVLVRHGFTATVFLVADYVGRDNAWPGHQLPMGRLALMSWDEAREMHRHGVELAAHTCTHPDLTARSSAEAEAEMVRSKNEIEERIGASVQTFAYPYGAYDEAAVEIARRHFAGACTTRMGRARPGDDPLVLDRIDMFYFQRPGLFTGWRDPLLDPYLRVRQFVRDLRSAS